MTVLATLGLGLGNIGMGWIFAGQVLLFPIIGVLHFFFGLIGVDNVPYSDTLVIDPVPSFKRVNIIPSVWLVQVTYFFTYLFLNARDIYKADPIDPSADYLLKVNNRKKRTMLIMISSVVFFVALFIFRIVARSELHQNMFVTLLSVLLSLAVGSVGAYIWNVIGGQPNVGTGKLDIFGISQQMILVPKTSEVTLCQGVSL